MLRDALYRVPFVLLTLLLSAVSSISAAATWSINDLASSDPGTVLKAIEQIPQEQIN